MLSNTQKERVLGLCKGGLILGGLIIVALWFSGCTALMSRTPVTETAILPTSQPLAYQRATTALVQMGATITASDVQAGLLSAQVKNAMVLNVQVYPHTHGAQVTATGVLMPDKMVIGGFTEVQDYMTLLKALP